MKRKEESGGIEESGNRYSEGEKSKKNGEEKKFRRGSRPTIWRKWGQEKRKME